MSDIIYYNVVMTGDRSASKTLAIFEEERVQALLQNPSDYYLSVIRFSVDGSWIPLYIMPVVINPFNPADVNTTPFIIYLTYGNLEFETPLVWIPESDELEPAPPTLNRQDLSNTYYYMYSYTTFVTMLNIALRKLYLGFTDQFINPVFPHHVNGLFDLVPGLANTPIPYFIYDGQQQKFSFIVPNVPNPIVPTTNLYQTQYDSSSKPIENVPDAIKIFMNYELNSIIDGFDYYSYNAVFGGGSIISPEEVLILVGDYGNNYYYPEQNTVNVPPPPPPPQSTISISTTVGPTTTTTTASPAWFIFTQQYKTIGLFNSLQSIVFTTNTLPIQQEYIPSSSVIGSRNNINGSIAFRNVLTDFTPDIIESGEQRSRFVYNPQGQYRLIDLKTTLPLVKLDLQMWWTDEYNNLYPLYLSYNASNSVKLMFIKKSLVKYNRF